MIDCEKDNCICYIFRNWLVAGHGVPVSIINASEKTCCRATKATAMSLQFETILKNLRNVDANMRLISTITSHDHFHGLLYFYLAFYLLHYSIIAPPLESND